MTTLDELERMWTLTTAVARYEQLRLRDSLADQDEPADSVSSYRPLTRTEGLELLALGEIIARKAAYGRQLGVRTARAAGASWAQIGQALGTSRQSAWEGHSRWIDAQAQRGLPGHEGLDDDAVAQARALAGSADEEEPR